MDFFLEKLRSHKSVFWTNFFSAMMKGADKVTEIPVVRNITDTAHVELNKILKNVSNDVVNNIGN